MAILIGGPPDSGKSVLCYALRRSLLEKDQKLKVFIQRANWDGEGNWALEMSDRQTAQQLKEANTRRIHLLENSQKLMNDYFTYHAKAIKNIQGVMDIVLVDMGGKIQPEKYPILQQCSHYIIISSSEEAVELWHKFFRDLQPSVFIHSVLDKKLIKLENNKDYLEVIAGPWMTGETISVPEIIVEKVLEICQKNLPEKF